MGAIKTQKLPELLSPAGSMDAFRAAIDGGADAIYIGGSAFKIAKSTIAFTGKLDLHPDKNKIIDFIETRNIHPVYLTDKEIFDIGGIVPLTENSTC